MVIKKSEIELRTILLSKKQEKEVAALEGRIDDDLLIGFLDGGRVVIHLLEWPIEKVRRVIELRYAEAGWKVRFCLKEREKGRWSSSVELS